MSLLYLFLDITIKIKGEAELLWCETETVRDNEGKEETRQVEYTASERYFENSFVVFKGTSGKKVFVKDLQIFFLRKSSNQPVSMLGLRALYCGHQTLPLHPASACTIQLPSTPKLCKSELQLSTHLLVSFLCAIHSYSETCCTLSEI